MGAESAHVSDAFNMTRMPLLSRTLNAVPSEADGNRVSSRQLGTVCQRNTPFSGV
jgi:hypothetical protein